jgi:hypothetical protein
MFMTTPLKMAFGDEQRNKRTETMELIERVERNRKIERMLFTNREELDHRLENRLAKLVEGLTKELGAAGEEEETEARDGVDWVENEGAEVSAVARGVDLVAFVVDLTSCDELGMSLDTLFVLKVIS